MKLNFSRREFLKATATASGGMMLGIYLPSAQAATQAELQKSPWLFVEIGNDGSVVIGARGAEIGQGVKTSLPMLIAEELDVAWTRVRVVQLPYVAVANKDGDGYVSRYGSQGAGGSTSIPGSFLELRQIGATARQMLVDAAAANWGLESDQLKTTEGQVIHPSGQSIAYGELATDAAKLGIPATLAPLKEKADFTIIGQPTRVTDARDIVQGGGYYGIDASIPGALIAMVARCPYFEGDIESVDATAAKQVPGVRHIVTLAAPESDEGVVANMAAGVAVVADDTWAAKKGRDALKIKWQPGKWGADSTAALEKRAQAALDGEGEITRTDGDVAAAASGAAQNVSADYTLPFLAHSTLEPQNALIDIKHNQVTVIASIQQPAGTASVVSNITGIDRSNIDVEIPRAGGGFGRRLEVDFVAEATLIAMEVGKPIKLIWSREDDLQNDYYRPFGVHRLAATLDDDNNVNGWSHKLASTGKRYMQPRFRGARSWLAVLEPDQFPAGCVDNYTSEFMEVSFGLLCGWWRAPAPTFLAFPIQSFVDEVAHVAQRDPLEMRLQLLGETRDLKYSDHGGPVFNTGRLATVTKKVAEAIGYGRKLPKGHGIGIASHFVFGGYAAHALEVSVVKGRPVIHRCVCAVDVGQVVNPLGVQAQMMGGTIDGLSTALNLEITVKGGKIQQSNFPNYPLLRMADAPDVEVLIVDSDLPPVGCGEMGIPTAAPALTNAIFAATGKRIRRLPIGDQLA